MTLLAPIPPLPRFTGELTDEHRAAIDAVHAEWMGHALSTERVDRAAIEAAAHAVYAEAPQRPPGFTIWMDSPVGGRVAVEVLRGDSYFPPALPPGFTLSLRDRLERTSGDEHVDRYVSGRDIDVFLADPLAIPFQRHLSHLLDEGIWVGSHPWPSLSRGRYPGNPAWAQVFGQLAGQVRDQLEGQDLYTRGCCSWLAPTPSREDDTGWWRSVIEPWRDGLRYASDRLAYAAAGLAPSPRLEHLAAATTGGWWWPLSDAIVLTDRPTVLERDGQGRLHSATGPALAYADGWAEYIWHGVTVPADLIETGWDITRILREPNSEVRRCAVEVAAHRTGWEQLIATAGWPLVGDPVDDPGNPGQTLRLYRVVGVHAAPVGLLRMTNGTPGPDGTRHEFAELVPASITDPIAAAAWQVDLSAAQYRETVRRT